MPKPPLPSLLLAALALLLPGNASAFLPTPSVVGAARHPHFTSGPLPPSTTSSTSPITPVPSRIHPSPPSPQSSTQLHSFFGLGPAELAIIAVAGLFLIGPSKLLEFTRQAGSVAGKTGSEFGEEWKELKSIPEEFQKGVEEGEGEARSRKAKVMDEVGEEE